MPAPSQAVREAGGLTGRTLGGFTLREQVGAGGFGDVYVAEQVALRREAIVKVLRPDEMDEMRVQRFLREAQLASRLDHPYAAHIYAFGAEPDGVFWIAMEHVKGASLRAVLDAQGPMPLDRFVPLLERICEVVQTAHEQGIIHRDLKPDNVMVISRAGRLLPKLLDFGIARAVGDQPTLPAGDLEREDPDRPVEVTTQRGSVLGSPSYMAPELWLDPHSAGPAADQYALGALAYEALTGKIAFTGRTVREVARAHARGARPPLDDTFAAELELVLGRALARATDARYGNVLEMAEAFRAASGIRAAAVELPHLDEELRVRFLTRAPQPIADAVAAYDAAKNSHQAREAMRGLVRTAGWYIGVLALACRTRVGSGDRSDAEPVKALLRELRRAGLQAPKGWVSLARELTRSFAALPDTHPLPELVLLFHGTPGPDVFDAVLEGSLAESLRDTSDEAAAQAIARELPEVTTLLRGLAFLVDYELALPRGGHAESWMGVRGTAKRIIPLRRSLAEGRPVIVDASGGAVVVVWPLIQVRVAVPGHPEQMFLLVGSRGQGALLMSSPHGFEHRDDTLWDWFRDQLFHQDNVAAIAPAMETPFRGLASYARADSQWFFGRERESEALVNRLKLEAFVAVVGPSGVGKSSFVQAGVVPSLPGWQVVVTRPGRSPLAQLGVHLAQAGLDFGNLRAAFEDEEAVVARVQQTATKAGGLLIVVDQFEELFTLGTDEDERALFARLLLALTRTAEASVRIIITLRDDFLIRAEQIPGLSHVLARGLQLLGPLSAPALERILIEPAKLAGYEFEDPAMPSRMVAEAIGTPAAVALISFTAARMWELRDRHFHQLPRKAYDAIGGVGGALARHADETVDAMPATERLLVREAFRHLVTSEGTRAVLERAELGQLLGNGADAERLVERLIEARLVISSENELGINVVEIIHEALLAAWPRLAEWRHEDVEGSRFHEQLRTAAKQWEDRGQPRGLLWRGDALAEYQLWRKRTTDHLTPLESAFGAASSGDATRGRRIRRTLIAIAAATTLAFVVVLFGANREAQESRRSAESLLRDSYVEEGRLMVLQGDKAGALPALTKAVSMGERSSTIALLYEEASRSSRVEVATLDGHTDVVINAVYTGDGTRIATASSDGTTRIFDANSGALIDVIKHEGTVLAVAANGNLVASGGVDKTIVVEDLSTKASQTLVAKAPVRDVLFSPDGTRLVSVEEAIVEVWKLPAGERVGELAAHGAASCGNGDCLVTWNSAGRVTVRDARSLAELRSYERGPGIVAGAVDRTGRVVAVAMESGEIDLLYADGRVVAEKAAHDKPINNLAFSPDDAILASSSDDGTARLWNAESGASRAVLSGHRAGVFAVQFSPRGDVVATASADGTARLWSATTGVLLADLSAHANIVSSVAFRPDGARLVTASWDHRAVVWDLAAAREFRALEPMRVDPPSMDRNPPRVVYGPGNTLAYVAHDGALVVTTVGSDQTVCRGSGAEPIDRLAWSPSARLIATVGREDKVVRIWDPRLCKVIHELTHGDEVGGFTFGPADQLVTGSGTMLQVWNVATEHVDATFADLPGHVFGVRFAPDGSRIFATTYGKVAVVIQEVGGARARQVLTGPTAPLLALDVDDVRGRVLVAGFDQHVWIWDSHTGKELARLEGTGPLSAVRRSPDDALVVAVGGLAPVVFDATTFEALGSLGGHSDFVLAGDFIADRLFVTVSHGIAEVWDLSKRRALIRFPDVEDVAVSPDRKSILFVGMSDTREWTPAAATPDRASLARLHVK